MSSPLKVLVLGVGGNVSQGLLKALYAAELPLEILGADVSHDQAGLFMVQRAWVGPWANDPAFGPWVLHLCKQEKVDVVLTGAEPVVKALAVLRDELAQHAGTRTIVSGPEVVEIGDDKWRTCEWLAAHGLPHPRYARSEDRDAVEALYRACGLPLIAKPRRGGGARGVFRIDDAATLDYALSRRNYLIQEYLGSDDEEYTAGCFADRDGVVRASMVMRRVLNAGTTYRAELGDFPEVRAVAEEITRVLRPEGPCNIQLRLTARGPVCFEINPRFSGTTPIRAEFGYNEAEAALRHFILGEDPAPLHDPRSGWALRYWNEVYVAPRAMEKLREERYLPNAAAEGRMAELRPR